MLGLARLGMAGCGMARTKADRGRSLKAVVIGGGWAALMIGLGLWFTSVGAATMWLFCGPWSVPGILLAVWGVQRH